MAAPIAAKWLVASAPWLLEFHAVSSYVYYCFPLAAADVVAAAVAVVVAAVAVADYTDSVLGCQN